MKTNEQLRAELEAAPGWALFPEDYVAAARSISVQVVRKDRMCGTGVPYVKQGRKVLYRKADIFDYLNGLTRSNMPEARPVEVVLA